MKIRIVSFGAPWVVERVSNLEKFWDIPFAIEYYDTEAHPDCQPWGAAAVLADQIPARWKNPSKDFTLLIAPNQRPPRDDQGKPVAETTFVGLYRPWDNVLQVFCDEKDHAYVNAVDMGDTFSLYANHEIAHYFYKLFNLPDKTHLYFYAGTPEKCVEELRPHLDSMYL